VGGTELYTQTLARYQARQEGQRVAVFYPSPEPPAPDLLSIREEEDGVRVYSANVGPRSRGRVFVDTLRRPEMVQALEAVLKKVRPDLVHIQHLMGLPAAFSNVLNRSRLPVIITLHDYWFPCANGQLITNYDNTICNGPYYWLNCGRCAVARAGLGDRPLLAPALAPLLAYRSRLVQGVLAHADRVIAPTDFVRDMYTRLGMPADRMVVVPHGIQVPSHVLQSAKQPRAPRQAGEPLHIVYVGSIAWQKGLHVLVEAANRLPHGAMRLSIYGDLDKFPNYVAQLRVMAQNPAIHFGGRIERDDFWRLLLEDADVAVLPTLWYEASPLTIQEMFAARVPIAGSRIGALPEKIRDGIDGLLFPPGDAVALQETLTRLLHDPQLLQTLRNNIQPTRLMEEHVRDVGQVYAEVRKEGRVTKTAR
jgi:glycosyltransferase involved in cell wall biosynthesis